MRTNRAGFSLIEVMFGLAISLIVGLAMFQMIAYQAKTMKGFELSFNWLAETMYMTQTLMTPVGCTSAIAGQTFNPLGSAPIVYTDQSGFTLSYGSVYQGIKTNILQIQSVSAISASQYYAKVYLQGQLTGAFIGPPVLNHYFPVRIDVAGPTIVDCF